MDAFDWKILSELQADPTIRVADLADRIGLSQTPCWRRLKALEETGVIARRAVHLNPVALGLRATVLAHLRLGRHDEETLTAFDEAVNRFDEILACFSMSGEFDYILHIVAESIEDYERFLKRVLLHLPGVASINSSFALKTIKLTTKLPISEDKMR